MATPARVLALAQTPYTPEWWVTKLAEKHTQRLPTLRKYLNYYDGNHDLSFASQRFRDHYGGLFKELAVNFCSVIVQAMVERMKVQGISVPTNDPDKPQKAHDTEAWAMWQRNGMDSHSNEHHTVTATTGYGYLTVWGDSDGKAVFTVEDPLQMIVAYTSSTPRTRAAALKRWIDEWTGYEFATLYLPDSIHRFRSESAAQLVNGEFSSQTDVTWVPRGDDATSVIDNPLGRVPVVEFVNDPTVRGEGRSELAPILPIQDASNKIVCDMMLASEFAAYPQRVLMGVEPLKDPETGKLLKPFEASIERVWTLANPNAKAAQFEAADLTNYVKAKESLLQDAAFISRTPRHYFMQSGQAPSGDSIKGGETGLVAKVKDREASHDDPYEETFRLGYLVEGKREKAEAWDAEIKWRDPEYRTEGELTDAVIKQHQANLIPWEFAVDRLGYSPQDIEKMRGLRVSEALLREATDLNTLLTSE